MTHQHSLDCLEDRGGRLYCKVLAGPLRMTPKAQGLTALREERRQREAVALKLVRAKSDLKRDAPVKYLWVQPDKNDMVTVVYKHWDNSPGIGEVFFDDKGAYLRGSIGERLRWIPSERRPEGELRADPFGR